MTGVTITANPAQIAALRVAFQRLAETGRAPSGALKSSAMAMLASARNRAEAEVDPDGAGWARLNPLYAASKRGPGILRGAGGASGLMGSLTTSVEGNAMRLGTNKEYAAIHQFGGKITPKRSGGRLAFMLGGRRVFARSVKIPARPFLGFSREDIEEVTAIFAEHAARAIRGA